MDENRPGYYGRPIVKPPVWTPLIPVYFWAGGWSGASATLALSARCLKRDRAARSLTLAAAVGTAISGFCLIADLKKPERFLHMFRVLKPSSPMSIGVYLFTIFGAASTAAAASEITGIARPFGRFAETIAGVTGPMMSVYTSVLIGDTVMPAWHRAGTALPVLFAATSASTAGGLGMCTIPAADAKPARRLAFLGALGVPIALERLRHQLGPVQFEAYERGKAGQLSHLARLCNLTGLLCTLFAKRNERIARFAGVMLLAAGLAERFAVYHAGKISAEDPAFTIAAESP
ncbi:MAG: polysulfide reductase NrfD [Candidatus Eremiobacteraeota bacterium]|nr:polysulfide reductase NrfD [Candidatus Eremiobacteraeota bacterium]